MSTFNPPASRSVTIPPMFVQNPETRNLSYQETDEDYDLERINKEHLFRVLLLILRGFSSLFSFLCFVIILTVQDFNKADTYNYVLAMSSLAIVYNVFQIAKGVNDLANESDLMSNEKVYAFIDFIGDQVVSYMVLSGSSAGIAATNEGRQLAEDMRLGSKTYQEYDKAAAATSMLFCAFLALIFPTLLSFHKLSQILTSS